VYNKQLEAFIVTAEAGSLSRAAEEMFISRPALIQQINLLENRVGFRLFDRNYKGVSLTKAGKIFYKNSKQIVRFSNSTLQQCKTISQGAIDVIRIGSLYNFMPVILPEICRVFIEHHPGIHLQFRDYPLEKYFACFSAGSFDITTEYIAGYVFDKPGYCFLKLLEDRHCCGVHPHHPLAGKDVISLTDLRGQKLMLYTRGVTKADDQLRDYLIKNEPSVELIDIDVYNSSLFLQCELYGYVLIYYSMYWQSFPKLIPIPVEWNIPIDIGLGYKANARPAVKKFIETARENLSLLSGVKKVATAK